MPKDEGMEKEDEEKIRSQFTDRMEERRSAGSEPVFRYRTSGCIHE